MATWGEQYVDGTVDRAWLELRVRLADRFESSLTSGDEEAVDFTTPDGQVLTAFVDDEQVVLVTDDEVYSTDNVDDAAYRIYQQLHEDWQVVHPAFLESEAVEPGCAVDEPSPPAVPVLGTASSREELQEWVETTLSEGLSHELRVQPNGDISWSTHGGSPVTVSVRDQYWIEVWVVVASEVGFGKARKMVQRLTKRHPTTSFKLDQDRLVACRVLDAGPYVPRHLEDALRYQLQLADQLVWVQEKVLRKRARRAREKRGKNVPAELMVLLPSANRISSGALTQEVRARAGSTRVLRDWRAVARHQRREAWKLGRGDADPDHVGHRLRMGWMRIGRAINRALAAADQIEDVA